MRTRIVIGAGAWLLGAAAATAGSLLVVSELGEGISAPSSQQSTVAAAEQAQASQPVAQPSATPTPRAQRSKSGTSGAAGTGGTAGTVLTSSGGTVVAQCAAAGAFLLSWSPQQGFQASSVARGPATTARVVFTTTASTVAMVVSCSGGMPVAASTVTSAAATPTTTATGDDNGGGGGNPGPGGGGGGDN
jgi:hypothetical protein